MADFSISILDADVGRVLDAFAAIYNRPEDSNETKAAHANRKVREYVQEIVTAHAVAQAQAAVEAARVASVVTVTDPAVVEGGAE